MYGLEGDLSAILCLEQVFYSLIAYFVASLLTAFALFAFSSTHFTQAFGFALTMGAVYITIFTLLSAIYAIYHSTYDETASALRGSALAS
jgi:uncharacterized membrane protein (DUF485 family)